MIYIWNLFKNFVFPVVAVIAYFTFATILCLDGGWDLFWGIVMWVLGVIAGIIYLIAGLTR